jgi:putative SOS response-associated peptidase YedK
VRNERRSCRRSLKNCRCSLHLAMCGRVTQKSSPNRLGLGLTTVNLVEPLYSLPPKYNGAPGQEHWVIRQHPKTGERTLDRLWWGLIPHWCKDAAGGRKPINAKGETVASLPSNWHKPGSEEWVRTFAVITTTANELVSDIHERMPVIIPPESYDRWLSSIEPDSRDLLVPFPASLMTMWPISTRVNKPDHDDPAILDALAPEEPSLL